MASSRSEFMRGARDAVPIIFAVAPFGLLFGALAAENGMSAFEATLMSAAIYAGASQMVGIELFGSEIPAWVIVLSILAVNFRHVLYSATMGQTIRAYSRPRKALAFFLMTDPQFAITEQRAELGLPTPFAWYLGLALPVYAMWVLEAYVGAVFGGLIDDPAAYGIDFLLPLYFLGMVMGFRGRANWLPVVVASALASVLAYHLVGSPWHVSLGGLAGIIVAAVIGVRPGHKLVV